jgi:8-oxo-dGTP pyrophosphatase MutT (NUDIX family)
VQPLQKLLDSFTPRGEQEAADYKYFQEFAKDPRNLTRDSIAHFTASAFVINPARDKTLGILHKLNHSWMFPGGHADGNPDLLHVARKEAQEETGLTALKLLQPAPIAIESISIPAHRHRTRGYVASHIHLDVMFLFEADETVPLVQNPDETSGVEWLDFAEMIESAKHNKSLEVAGTIEKVVSRIKEAK